VCVERSFVLFFLHELVLSLYKGIVLRICGTVFFSAMAVLIKLVGSTYPAGELVFVRSVFATIPILAMLISRGELSDGLITKRPFMHLTRVSSGVIAMFFGFSALTYLPLPDTTAINFAAPLFTVIFSMIILKERVRIYRWTAVAAGFAGVALIFSPHMHKSLAVGESAAFFGSMLALGGAVFSASSMVSVRRLAQTEKTSAIVFYFSVGSAVLASLSALLGWIMPTPHDAMLMITIGLFGGVGQIFMTHSYRYAEASFVAPFDYIALLWAIVFGWLFFSDVPSLQMLLGAAIVIIAGIFVIWREHGHISAVLANTE
jgi:drug/metabolite transporter (DMT)-like permease